MMSNRELSGKKKNIYIIFLFTDKKKKKIFYINIKFRERGKQKFDSLFFTFKKKCCIVIFDFLL